MLKRVLVVGAVPFVFMLSCGDDDSSSGGESGAAGEAGQNSNPGGGTTPNTAGSTSAPYGGAGSPAGGGGATGHATEGGAHEGGHGGQQSVAGDAGQAALGGAGSAGAPSGGGGAAEGGGGAGPVGCLPVVGTIPPGPTFPAATACASGCSVPPMDGTTLKPECGDQQSTPPASAIGAPNDDEPSGMIGLPCDTGWCPAATLKQIVVGDQSFGGPFYESVGMAIQAPETAHIARFQDYYGLTVLRLSAAVIVGQSSAFTPPDYEKYSTPGIGGPGDPGPFPPNVDDVLFDSPVLGVDPRAGQQTVYLAYGGATRQPPLQPKVTLVGQRFGTGYDASWTFEDLPAGWAPIKDIQVDETGAAVVVQAGAVYRHLSAGGWEPVQLPCGVTARQVAIETATGTWYVSDSQSSALYQRAANGTWTSEVAPYSGRLLLAGGTVHIETAEHAITHRAGSAWSTPIVPTFGTHLSIPIRQSKSPPDVAVDACWAPHFAYARFWGDPSEVNSERVYTRWTSRGFLTQTAWTGDFTDVAIVAGPDHVFVHANGSVDVIALR